MTMRFSSRTLWRWAVIYSGVLSGVATARDNLDPACLALWQECDPRTTTCEQVQKALDVCKPPQLPPPAAAITSMTACKAVVTAASEDDAPQDVVPDEFKQLRLLEYAPDKLRSHWAALLSRYRWGTDAKAQALDRKLGELCRFSHPIQHKDGCSDAFEQFTAEVTMSLGQAVVTEEAATAFRRMIRSPGGQACLERLWPADDSWRYVMVAGRTGDRVTALQSDVGRQIQRSYRAPRPVMLTHDVQLTVAAVPRGLEALVRVESPDSPPGAVTTFEVAANERDWLLDARSAPSMCLDLDVLMSPGASVLVDGVLIAQDTQLLRKNVTVQARAGHNLAVLSPRKDGPRKEGTDLTYHAVDEARASPPAHGCVSVRHEAVETASNAVALLPIEVADECASGGINEISVLERFKQFLIDDDRQHTKSDQRLELRDLSALDTVYDFSKVDALVGSLRGGPMGPERGAFDSTRNLYGGAKELLRQGFTRLVSASVRCNKTGHGWEYAVSVRSANLKALEAHTNASIPWSAVFATSTLIMTDRRELYDGVVEPLASVLGIPHIRFAGDHAAQTFVGRIHLPVEIRPDRGGPLANEPEPHSTDKRAASSQPDELALPTLRVERIARFECQRVEDAASLRGVRPPRRLSPGPVWQQDREWFDEALEVSSSASFKEENPQPSQALPERTYRLDLAGAPSRSGYYLVQASLANGPYSSRCLEVVRDTSEIFATLGFRLWDVYNLGAPERPERQYYGTYALLGLGETTGWGVRAGVWMTSRRGRTPPSFSGLAGNLTFDVSGEHEYRVVERSLLLGPSLSMQDSVCVIADGVLRPFGGLTSCTRGWRRIHAVARLTALVKLGFVDLDETAPNVFPTDRQGDSGNVDLDLSLLGEGGVGVHLSEAHSLRFLFTLFLPKLSDLISGHSHTAPTYDSRLIMGLGLEYGRTL